MKDFDNTKEINNELIFEEMKISKLYCTNTLSFFYKYIKKRLTTT